MATKSTSTGRRARAKADKQARILAAARDRLATQGYDGMTMAQVADDADVAAGTVFQYAATKPELLMMVTAAQWQDLIPAVIGDATRERSAADGVRRLLAPLVSEAARDPATSMAVARELLFGAAGQHRTAVVGLVHDLEVAIAAVLRRHGAGETADAAARLIVSGGVLELNRTRTGRATSTSVAGRIDELVAIVLRGTLPTGATGAAGAAAATRAASAG